MNGFSGHIERFDEFDAADDAAAIVLSRTMRGPLSLELWCAHRKVARIEAIDLTSQLLAQRAERKAVKARVEPAANADDNTNAENRSA
jgi:hypothetical protein